MITGINTLTPYYSIAKHRRDESLAKHRRDERQRMDGTNQIIVGPLVILGIVIDGHYRTMTLDQEE